MNDEQYLQHCRTLLDSFASDLAARVKDLPKSDPLVELSAAFSALDTALPGFYEQGPALVARLFTTYPDLAPLLPRQLLWFFGGDCLHFMADEEISLFQQLEDMRRAAAQRGEQMDLQDARAKLLNLQ